MLGKLIKYECKATGRTLLPLYGALLVLSVLLKVQNNLARGQLNLSFQGTEALQGWLQAITILLYAGLMAATLIMTVLLLIQRFYKNLLGTEGYLMFTLPTSVDKLIFSKLLTATLWSVVSFIAAMISIMVLALGLQDLRFFFSHLGQFFSEMNQVMGAHGYILMLEVIVLGVFGLMQSILQVYGGIAIGHLMPRHRVLGSIGGYLALSVISTLIMQLLGALAYPITNTASFQQWVENLFLNDMTGQFIAAELVMLLLIVITVLFGVGFYVVTRLILKKKLNLE